LRSEEEVERLARLRHRAASLRCVLALVNLAPPEQVIQAAHPIPAIAIGLDDEPVRAVLVAVTMLLCQQIHEQPLGLIVQANRETDLMRFGSKIMHEQHPIVAPGVAHHEDGWIAAWDD